jgi:hypothetical protein
MLCHKARKFKLDIAVRKHIKEIDALLRFTGLDPETKRALEAERSRLAEELLIPF